jgi:glutamate synthase (ferredoxin)
LYNVLDSKVLVPNALEALEGRGKAKLEVKVGNTDRVFGTILGSEITKRYGEAGLPEDTIWISTTGAGGQSFGAFIPKGLTLELEGDANDYIGKGLSGGKIIVYESKESALDPTENILVGNVALYGATSGKAFIKGVAGERFGVRNSGATAVVEGVGDHGCEYMTGGTVVILGPVGRNFAAGMSGGVVYILDECGAKRKNINESMVYVEELDASDESNLLELLQEHEKYTASEEAKKVTSNFEEYKKAFIKVMPKDYKNIITLIKEYVASGSSKEDAERMAFDVIKGVRK